MSGFAIEVDNSCDDWDYVPAADYLLKRLRELRQGVSRVCLISGGEITVKVEGKGGVAAAISILRFTARKRLPAKNNHPQRRDRRYRWQQRCRRRGRGRPDNGSNQAARSQRGAGAQEFQLHSAI